MQRAMRQLKSSAKDLREMFEQSITVRHFIEQLESCDIKSPVEKILEVMESRDFDVLGITEHDTVCGYVVTEELVAARKLGARRLPRRCIHIFDPSVLISVSTSLISLLPILRDSLRLFVLDGNRITGIVTRGDLQKAPFRMFLFGLITLLEMNFLRLINAAYLGDPSLMRYLSPGEIRNARRNFNKHNNEGEALTLLDYLQLNHKNKIILGYPRLCSCIFPESYPDPKQTLESIKDLRNTLAHANDLASGPEWPPLIDLAILIETLLTRCESIDLETLSNGE